MTEATPEWFASEEYRTIKDNLSHGQAFHCRICSTLCTRVSGGGYIHTPYPDDDETVVNLRNRHFAEPYISVPESWEPSTEKATTVLHIRIQEVSPEYVRVVVEGVARAVCNMCLTPLEEWTDGMWVHMDEHKTSKRVQLGPHDAAPKLRPARMTSKNITTPLEEAAVPEERRDYGTSDSPMTKEEYESLPRVSAESTQGSGEIRMTDPTTGAQKGSKEARFDLIPVGPLTELAELYGFGAKKYAARNWERGYDFSLSYAALQRHANLFWGGEDRDAETGKTHLSSVAWHAFTLMQLLETHPEKDDRPSRELGDYDGIEVRDGTSSMTMQEYLVWQAANPRMQAAKQVPNARRTGKTAASLIEANRKAFEAEAAGENGKIERTATKMSETMAQKLENAEALQEYEDLELQEVFETMATLSRQGLSRVINEAGRRLEFDDKAQAEEAETPKETGVEEEPQPKQLTPSHMTEVGLLIPKMSTGQLLEMARAVEKQLEEDD